MAHVQQHASLAPTTVTKVSTDSLEMPRRRRRAQARPAQRVTYQRVHPLVWQAALKAAKGEANRIEVISMTEVVVH